MYRKRAKNIFTEGLEFKHSRVIKQVKKTPGFSADSSEHLWLVIAFISSTEPCVIDYNVKTRLYLAQHQPGNADLNLAADDRRAERFNHSGGIVSNIEILYGYFLYFGSCIQNPLGSIIEWLWMKRICPCLTPSRIALVESAREIFRGSLCFQLVFISLEQETSSLHDLTDYYVERATAPHYKTLSFMFS